MNPRAIDPASGRAMRISSRKQAPIVATRTRMNASIFRIPAWWRNRMRNVSSAVNRTPYIRGSPNSSWSPIADPSTSARSHAAIASSHRIHSTALTAGGYRSRHAWARSRPETSPSRAERDCSRTAIRFDIRSTQMSAYP
jgi:hypothetical protein